MSGGHSQFGILGLLGGMGPSATADVLAKIAQVTEAAHDQDHIPIIVRSVPQIPDRTDALFDRGPSPEPALIEGALSLRAAGTDFLAIACNTAHHWYKSICDAVGLPVVHIADAVLHDLQNMNETKHVGLLATAGTIKSGFYQHILGNAGMTVVIPDDLLQSESIDKAIALTKSGQIALARQAIGKALEALESMGTRVIILACTELPLLAGGIASPDVRLLDANVSLARACLRTSRAFATKRQACLDDNK